jgi:hypothetical protein
VFAETQYHNVLAPAPTATPRRYSYDNRYGIDVNQILYGGVLGKTSGGPCLASPSNSPYYFAEGVSIADNYVYQVGGDASAGRMSLQVLVERPPHNGLFSSHALLLFSLLVPHDRHCLIWYCVNTSQPWVLRGLCSRPW